MVEHVLPNFLRDPSDYARAEDYWVRLWTEVDEFQRRLHDWRHPWLSSGTVGGAELRDGNPIFSAYSPERRCGIRVIQYPPESDHLEFRLVAGYVWRSGDRSSGDS